MKIKADYTNAPQWKEVTVKSTLPAELKCLDELAHNMWWAWNYEARDMWKSLDNALYDEVGHNPVMLLDRLSYERKEAIVKDKAIMERVKAVYKKFREYMDVAPDAKRPSVAYFCMEYGINQVVKIYSGGLGMLAGDYMKEASDSNVNMCGVGFLYRYGYFKQTLSMDGQQIAQYDAQNFNSLPVERVLDENGQPLVVDVPYMNYQVHAYVWVMNVGRIKLYLLDTDNEMNSEFDRPITHALYGGDNENRLKQEILLGIGGILTLKKLGIKKDIYHCNEGHAALCNLQRLIDYIHEGMSFNEALELVRASSLYTVHTPVPAGHDYFDESLFGKYMGGYPQMLGISWDEFIGMGRTNPDDHSERFCMSTFACNTCQEVNGVSKLHGWVSQRMFAPIWKGYYPEESHVGYVTNGVHFPTWTATEWRKVYAKYFDKNYIYDQSNESLWHAIYNVPDAEIWETRMALKKKLVDYIREKFAATWLKNQGDPSRVVALLESITPNALYIGFCRRFATYKRAHLLFTDLERLSKIVNNPERPVKFIFSGKAHPADGAGQGLIKRIFEISQRPEFLGKIIFLEDYDMELARRLVSGVDIWMNTPTRPLEASGTSGEKAEMNGVVNLSVLDGWWVEGYREGAGWALKQERTYQNQGYQDQLDAATIYSLLENEILPLFYNRNEQGYSEGWIKTIKSSIATIAPHYTMKRQLDDYYDKFYTKQAANFKKLAANNNRLAKELAAWKETVAQRWDSIRVVSKDDSMLYSAETGKKYTLRYVIDEQGLNDAIGLELVSIKTGKDGEEHIFSKREFEVVAHEGNNYTFEATFEP
uniref:alpha-glucan family phosphorylase n=1 Tax=Prevotella sp. TaxID=59823 RepID=UPI0027E33D93